MHEKKILQKNKKRIQTEFLGEFSMHVDFPRSRGAGNTNTGNVARKCFRNYQLFSKITGVDMNLISNIGTVLSVLSSGYAINVDSFKNLCDDIFSRYVQLYGWFYMPVTLHKILLHGHLILRNFSLPIGLFSEEAGETRNKDPTKF